MTQIIGAEAKAPEPKGKLKVLKRRTVRSAAFIPMELDYFRVFDQAGEQFAIMPWSMEFGDTVADHLTYCAVHVRTGMQMSGSRARTVEYAMILAQVAVDSHWAQHADRIGKTETLNQPLPAE